MQLTGSCSKRLFFLETRRLVGKMEQGYNAPTHRHMHIRAWTDMIQELMDTPMQTCMVLFSDMSTGTCSQLFIL